MADNKPIFSFGVVADVQYGDKPDAFLEGRTQRYREAPGKLASAVETWTERKDELSFVLTLGDVIDGNTTPEATNIDLETVAKEFDKLQGIVDVHHVIGNHCLALGREHILKSMQIPSSFYTVEIVEGWKLIVLDTTEMSLHSKYPEESWQMKETLAFVDNHPADKHVNMARWNGGITSKQLQWLQNELHMSDQKGERVIIACHHPVGSGRPTHQAWDAKTIEHIISESACVKLVFSGHDHEGGYFENGKHFVTLEALLEAPTGSNAFGCVHVYGDRIEIDGVGSLTSRVLKMN